MSKDQDNLKTTWTERWNLAVIGLIFGLAFEFGQWLMDIILPNVK
jgi:glycopeptide antibiotics resistance protein